MSYGDGVDEKKITTVALWILLGAALLIYIVSTSGCSPASAEGSYGMQVAGVGDYKCFVVFHDGQAVGGNCVK